MISMVSSDQAIIAVRRAMADRTGQLTTADHSRSEAGMTYVYPVVSRRAGGVSVGINLNPNNACNWRCIYCQVPDLRRGGPPPIDLNRLTTELDALLDDIVSGDFLARRVPAGQQRLVDVAFSGNGEPTSAAEFPAAVDIAIAALRRRQLIDSVKLRLITNGSLVDRPAVQAGLRQLGSVAGEVWFKVDAGDAATLQRINGIDQRIDLVSRRLARAAELCPTWVQTCLFAIDGEVPTEAHLQPLMALIGSCRDWLRGVHLYGLARPSAQAEAGRLTAVSAEWLAAVAERIRRETGLAVTVSP
jgi:wyosine [tRNA(Phe)-imidazoG37] synthetase (radical SAM superfamily)